MSDREGGLRLQRLLKIKLLTVAIDLQTIRDAISSGRVLVEDGGPGSGNFGHEGRPGLVGGSGPRGGGAQGSSAWSKTVRTQHEGLKAKSDNDKAYFLDKAGFMGTKDAVRARDDGTIDERLDEYFKILEKNGDTGIPKGRTATKENKGMNSDEERLESIVRETGASEAEAKKMYDAIKEFTGGYFRTADGKRWINKYLERAPVYEGEIHRGIKFNSEEEMLAFAKKPGGTIEMIKGPDVPSSWSSEREVARRFAGSRHSAIITCLKNRTGAPIEKYTLHGGEDEILLPGKARWTVLRSQIVEHPNGESKRLHLTVIEQGDR